MRSVRELREFIERDEALCRLEREVSRRIAETPAPDPGHDLAHFLRVALWTVRIGGRTVDPREGIAAALLHDIVPVEKNSPLRGEASRLCAEEAARILPDYGFSAAESARRIADAIRCHSFSRGERPRSALGQALQDADRLEALGSIGLMRVISVGVRMGADYFHPTDPWAKGRSLDDTRYSIDHFFAKLLKLPDTMLTQRGRLEAKRRAGILLEFLSRLGEELGEPLPALSEDLAKRE